MSKRISIVRTFIEECGHPKYDEDCILESFTKNCLQKNAMGTFIGVESLLIDYHDWFISFPDFSGKIQSIKEYQNIVICDVMTHGTYLHEYKSTNQNQKSILTTSGFSTNLKNVAPTRKSFDLPGRLIFTFERLKISHFLFDSDLFEFSRQLGLEAHRANSNSSTDEPLSLASLNEALGTALSMREVECLSLAICGFSAKHAATVLHMSYRTVETHWNHAYRKLGCFGKQQLIDSLHEKQLFSLWLEVGKRVLAHHPKRESVS